MAAARSVTWDGWPSLPAGACRAAGPGRRQHPVLGDQRRGQRVDRDPGCGEPGGQEVGQSVQPGLGRRIMRADDAAGERGDPGDERDAAGPPSRMEPAAHWASRFTASISSNWAAVLSSSGWRLLSPALLTSTAHPPGPALRPGLMPHQQSGTRAAADSCNGTALHQASHIPGSGGFLPIFLPKEAAQRSRGALSRGHSSKME